MYFKMKYNQCFTDHCQILIVMYNYVSVNAYVADNNYVFRVICVSTC